MNTIETSEVFKALDRLEALALRSFNARDQATILSHMNGVVGGIQDLKRYIQKHKTVQSTLDGENT